MGIILKADNRTLLNDAKYSFMIDHYPSNSGSIQVLNSNDFSDDDYVLLGNFGTESAEILKIDTVTPATHTITFKDELGAPINTQFSHPESTRVTILPYNEIRFFHTAMPTYSPPTSYPPTYPERPTIDTLNPLTDYVEIQPDSWFTTWDDELHSTGWGFFLFRNKETEICSQPSNPIPYAGFEADTVKSALDGFYSLLNNKEVSLVSRDEAMMWLNEAYSLVRSRLNLVNREYGVALEATIDLRPGVIEYRLPDDFADMVTLSKTPNSAFGNTNPVNNIVEYITLKEAPYYGGYSTSTPYYTGTLRRYYLREKYLGILPTPDKAETYYLNYITKSTRLGALDDVISLPDNGFYILKDFMMYRANMKFGNGNTASVYYKTFVDGLNNLVLTANKRDSRLDTWHISRNANA